MTMLRLSITIGIERVVYFILMMCFLAFRFGELLVMACLLFSYGWVSSEGRPKGPVHEPARRAGGRGGRHHGCHHVQYRMHRVHGAHCLETNLLVSTPISCEPSSIAYSIFMAVAFIANTRNNRF